MQNKKYPKRKYKNKEKQKYKQKPKIKYSPNQIKQRSQLLQNLSETPTFNYLSYLTQEVFNLHQFSNENLKDIYLFTAYPAYLAQQRSIEKKKMLQEFKKYYQNMARSMLYSPTIAIKFDEKQQKAQETNYQPNKVLNQEKKQSQIMQSKVEQDQSEIEKEIMLMRMQSRKSSCENGCYICCESYSLLGKWPLIICSNEHVVCDECVEVLLEMATNEPPPCPQCRKIINPKDIYPCSVFFKSMPKTKIVTQRFKQQQNIFRYAFEKEIFEIAKLYKQNKQKQLDILDKINANNKQLTHIEYLNNLPNLIYLSLAHNSISSIDCLDKLKLLMFLDVSHNVIKNIDVKSNKMLEFLNIEENLISQFEIAPPITSLRYFFTYGNNIKPETLEQLFSTKRTIQIFSISCKIKHYTQKITQNLDSLKVLIVGQENRFTFESQTTTVKLRNQRGQKWINNLMKKLYQYGDLSDFKPDPLNSHFKDYKYSLQQRKLQKVSNNFTVINDIKPIPKNKINLKFRIKVSSTQNITLGFCNAFLKSSPNIYSEHFVGLGLWGNLYVRGESIAVTNKMKVSLDSVLSFSIDKSKKQVCWHLDDQQIASIELPQQLLHSELYFLIAIRDKGVVLQFIDEY